MELHILDFTEFRLLIVSKNVKVYCHFGELIPTKANKKTK